jgi:phosphohistidine phosphatase
MYSDDNQAKKTLLILRHAKSSWKDDSLADHDRPLKKRGRRDARRMGTWLQEQQLLPDVILTSTAVRARETTQLTAEGADYAGPVRAVEALYHAEPEEIVGVLRTLEDTAERVMIVGHNPGLEMLLEDLVGKWRRLPTATLAQVTLPLSHWRALTVNARGVLVTLQRARDLPEKSP